MQTEQSRKPKSVVAAEATDVATRTLSRLLGGTWVTCLDLAVIQFRLQIPALLLSVTLLIMLAIGTLPMIFLIGEFIGNLSVRAVGAESVSAKRVAASLSLILFFTLLGWLLVILIGNMS